MTTKEIFELKKDVCESIGKSADIMVKSVKSVSDRELLERIYKECYMIRRYTEMTYMADYGTENSKGI